MNTQELISIVYVPCSSEEEAKKISNTLLNEKLIACANISSALSLYQWEGKNKEASEKVIIGKTLPEKRALIEKRIKELHTYDCPCILFIEASVNKEYFTWCRGELNG